MTSQQPISGVLVLSVPHRGNYSLIPFIIFKSINSLYNVDLLLSFYITQSRNHLLSLSLSLITVLFADIISMSNIRFILRALIVISLPLLIEATGNCEPNNCLRAFQIPAQTTAASSFCSSFLATSTTATNAIPTFVGPNCPAISGTDVAMRVSSACSCVIGSTTVSTTSATATPPTSYSPPPPPPTTSSSPTSSPTSYSPPPPPPTTTSLPTSTTSTIPTPSTSLDCQPDNCLRQLMQSTAVTAFCATYTQSVNTATTNLPPYVSQCSLNPPRVSSACSCVVTPTSSSTSTTPTTTSTTSYSPPPPPPTTTPSTTTSTTTPTPVPTFSCQLDQCLQQFNQAYDAAAYCVSYARSPYGIPAAPSFAPACNAQGAVASACACFIPTTLPTPTPSSTTTVTTSTAVTTLIITNYASTSTVRTVTLPTVTYTRPTVASTVTVQNIVTIGELVTKTVSVAGSTITVAGSTVTVGRGRAVTVYIPGSTVTVAGSTVTVPNAATVTVTDAAKVMTEMVTVAETVTRTRVRYSAATATVTEKFDCASCPKTTGLY